MNIVFRVDGGKEIGTGHIMRCITLAKELKKSGARVAFICQLDSKHLESLIKNSGVDVSFLSKDVAAAHPEKLMPEELCKKDALETQNILEKLGEIDWLVVDHYGIDINWENRLRPHVKNIMVIDDLANRQHNCDLLLDQNFYINADTRYNGLVSENCIKLLGPSYALLREEFSSAEKCIIKDEVKNILISFGGSDLDNFTGKVLNILKADEYKNITINVVMGVASQHKEAIEKTCNENPNMHYHLQIDYMARLMSGSDLFIGAGGATSWERLALALPSIVIAIADNQIEVCENLQKANLASYIGNSGEFSPDIFKKSFENILNNFTWRKDVSVSGKKLVDGRGAKKVAAYLQSFSIKINKAQKENCEDIYQWRNAAENREFSKDNSEFTFESHQKWFEKIIISDSSDLLIAYQNHKPLGVVRFDYDLASALISIYLVPNWHGKGWGSVLLLSAENWLHNNKLEIKQINAEILKDNHASGKTFRDCNYNEASRSESSIFMTKEL